MLIDASSLIKDIEKACIGDKEIGTNVTMTKTVPINSTLGNKNRIITVNCVVEYVAFTIALCPGARLLLDIVIELVIWSSIIQILDRYTVPVFWHHVG